MLTHAHFDHIQGLVESLDTMVPAFPNAVVHMSREEYEYWTAETVRTHIYECIECVNFLSAAKSALVPTNV